MAKKKYLDYIRVCVCVCVVMGHSLTWVQIMSFWRVKPFPLGLVKRLIKRQQSVNNTVLLYSTRNSTSHPVINCNGKEYEKECESI